MRTFETTHPWITFRVDLRKASPRLWMKLGEAQSKCDHIAGVPLRPATAKQLHQIYLAKGALATTAIEGNTLSEDEVMQHLEGKLDLPPSKQYLVQEVDNIIQTCNRISEAMCHEDLQRLTVDAIKEYNRNVLQGLELREGVVPGAISSVQVGVPGYRGAPPADCQYLLERLCDWLNGEEFHIKDGPPVAVGLIRAIIAHIYLAWIHAFGDGNGRTARLVEFQLLLASGVPTPAAHLLSNHYNQTRQTYYQRLRQASRSQGDVLPFMEYAVEGFVEELTRELKIIREQQWDVAWENYVHDQFRNRTKQADIRRRHLVLDLSELEGTIPVAEIRRISPRIAEAYAGKTRVTISRDLNELVSMNLIERTSKGVRAKREIILAFLPHRTLQSE